MKRLYLSVILLMALSGQCFAQGADICSHPKLFFLVNISSATTTQVAGLPATGPQANWRVIVCGYNFTVAGTTPSYLFEYGTGTTCGTGTTAITGTYLPTVGTLASYGDAGYTLFATNSGTNLCIVSGGTPSIQGVVDYVVAP